MAEETKQEQSPDTRGKAQEAMLPSIELFRDVLGGTQRMRDAGESYLPKFELEENVGYKNRLSQAVLYNATELTLDAFVGLIFRTEPELAEDLPKEIVQDLENADLGGRHVTVLAKEFFRDAWDGLAAILVEMQRPGEIRNRAEEKAAGLRPYWIPICAKNILRARSITINGKETLSSFAYLEEVTIEDGDFREKTEIRVRDYRLVIEGTAYAVQYRVYAKREKEDGKVEWETIEGPDLLRVGGVGAERGKPLDEIPVAVCYTNRTGFFSAEPPLLDLAYENIDHYQQRSEHRRSWQYVRIPIQVYPGMTMEQLSIAPDRGITTPTSESKPYYMQADSAAMNGSREELRECERRMANLGAQMLFRPEKSNETATARRIENAQSSSRLASAARALQDCLEEATRLHAKWRRIELPQRTEGRWITVNSDFSDFELDAQQIAALDAAVGSGHLRIETFLTALRDGVPVLSFIDPETEAALLESEGMDDPVVLPPGRKPPALDDAA